MAPIHASDDEIERGKRLALWLDRVGGQYPKYLRGEKIFHAPRQTVESWIKGADISNEGICRILEVDGIEALEWILGTKAGKSRGESGEVTDSAKIHGKSVKFWYAQYVRERSKSILTEKPDYSALPTGAQKALEKADERATVDAKTIRAIGSKKPRIKKHDFPE